MSCGGGRRGIDDYIACSCLARCVWTCVEICTLLCTSAHCCVVVAEVKGNSVYTRTYVCSSRKITQSRPHNRRHCVREPAGCLHTQGASRTLPRLFVPASEHHHIPLLSSFPRSLRLRRRKERRGRAQTSTRRRSSETRNFRDLGTSIASVLPSSVRTNTCALPPRSSSSIFRSTICTTLDTGPRTLEHILNFQAQKKTAQHTKSHMSRME